MMWEAFQSRINEQGGQVKLRTKVTGIKREGNRITAITTVDEQGTHEVRGDYFISSMPLTALLGQLDPPPPENVLLAAGGLRYRDFLIVGLILDRAETFPDNWIYIHDPGVQVGRVQNFKNWSAAMVPDQSKTSLGMEYFCNEGDDLWQMADDDLVVLATREMETLGLGKAMDVIDGCVIRQRKAYPVYDNTYQQHLDVIRHYLEGFENLQTIGRNGMHRYNNQDHSMLTGLLAARNLVGEQHDLWAVNTDRSYYEAFEVAPKEKNRPVNAENRPAALENDFL
jgi:protoporphyrinogen oxidase